MKLYHGTNAFFERPDLSKCRPFKDFGRGFYTTTSYEQAERWARIKMRREKKDTGYVAVYEFDYEAAKTDTTIRRFDAADMEWLLFVANNRRGLPLTESVDMHVGPVADDNVYQSIRFFETGILNAEETVKRLKTEVLQDQWIFHTEKILSYCTFLKYTEVKEAK